ncbi:sporulation protein YpjB [Bacillus sp. UMB0893]|uniref:sporulation protein YpjB n=1 Tax=Bacillus sp. UMB0893 TaxID=2066053 RepID=UPI000C77F780|nr:sporulation protein YpjB [Bacillus sp. UMB0893]PLR66782.1 sporulation protein YpjB [Bacillus sp. UMB0893]
MKKTMIAIAVSILMIFTYPALFYADHHEGHSGSWEDLNKLSDTALQLSKQSRFEESVQLVEYFSREFEEMTKDNESISAAQIRTISSSQHTALDTLQEKNNTPDEKVRSLIQLRLVVDAMVSEHQPLWVSMEDPIMTVFANLIGDVENKDHQSFEQDWSEFVSLYEMIYPSIMMDTDTKQVQRIDAHISVVEDSVFKQIPLESKVNQLSLMEEELQNLFDRIKEDEADPSLLWVMISTGSIILLSLSYTGWRKFKGEKEKANRERDMNK